VAGQGVRERRNSKRKERLKRRKTNDLNPKRQTKSKIQNTHEYVCNFNIKFLCPKCPPYNIQKAEFLPSYREKYPSI
jgi:hypothetical protein